MTLIFLMWFFLSTWPGYSCIIQNPSIINYAYHQDFVLHIMTSCASRFRVSHCVQYNSSTCHIIGTANMNFRVQCECTWSGQVLWWRSQLKIKKLTIKTYPSFEGTVHLYILTIPIPKTCFKFKHYKPQSHLPGDDELTHWPLGCLNEILDK